MSVPLRSRWLGLELEHPLIAAASPATGTLDGLLRLEDGGAAAAVLPSLFEEQIVHEEWETHCMFEWGAESTAEATSYFPELTDYNTGPEQYLDLLRWARERLSIPVIASLNGHTPGGWVEFARQLEQAGARALELNIAPVPVSPEETAARVEARAVEIVRSVHEVVSIPIAIKLAPYWTSLPALARALEGAGADGLVLFNRLLAPDIDLETLEVVPRLELSRPFESLQALRAVAILRDLEGLDLAATGGIHGAAEALKLSLAGADAVQVAAALLQHGPRWMQATRAALGHWLEEQGYESLEQARGSLARRAVPDPRVYERMNYMRALTSWSPALPP